MDLSLQIDRMNADELTTEHFRDNYLKKARPLIIKGYSQLYPAGKKWTFEYLKKKVGSFQVGVFDNRIKTTTAYVKPDRYIPFSQYLDILSENRETPFRIFLFNMFKDFPELRKEFPTPVIMKGILGKMGFAFFGGKNTKVRFHYDIDASNVLMTQVIGSKRVILVSPDYNKLLYKLPFSSFSLIDPENPDLEQFPALKYVKGYDFILHPGDALFMPSRFWHYNTYLDGGMAVSYRSLAVRTVDLYHGIMNTTLRLGFDKVMTRIFNEKWTDVKTEMAYTTAAAEITRARYTTMEYKIIKPVKEPVEAEHY